jgi:hypothetical protein
MRCAACARVIERPVSSVTLTAAWVAAAMAAVAASAAARRSAAALRVVLFI